MTSRPEIISMAQHGLLSELELTPANTEFMDKGNCKTVQDPDLFFSVDAGGIRLAKMICAECPVRLECLQFGESEEFGVFGGLTPGERRSHKIQRAPQKLPLVDLVAQKRFIEKASVEQVSRRYQVETRTVQRWRKILKNYDQKDQHESQR